MRIKCDECEEQKTAQKQMFNKILVAIISKAAKGPVPFPLKVLPSPTHTRLGFFFFGGGALLHLL